MIRHVSGENGAQRKVDDWCRSEKEIIGQLSFDIDQFSFPETTDFMSVVLQFSPKNESPCFSGALRAPRWYEVWPRRLKLKDHRHEVGGLPSVK